MNLHEFQGKSILKSFGVAIQEGKVVDKVEDAVETRVNSCFFKFCEIKIL
mgnify:CR=1 FL=1